MKLEKNFLLYFLPTVGISIFLGYVLSSTSIHLFASRNPKSNLASVSQTSTSTLATSGINLSKSTRKTLASQPLSSPILIQSVAQPILSSQVVTPAAVATQTAPSIPTLVDFEQINATARKSLVNIICTTKVFGPLDPITATGVIIDEKGTILTNAHVAEYLLLQNFQTENFVTCTIRTGSPARDRYHAELLYISPTWVQNNKSLLTQTNPQGTGENDFALLRITDSINGSPLPSFSFIPPDVRENVTTGEQVNLISYPAGFLGSESILQNLDLTSALTTVQHVYTFTTTSVDLISVGGTVVSQKGASGGAVVDRNGTLIGLISTESDAAKTADRDLRAITLAHINRTLQTEIGQSLALFLSQDLAASAKNFQTNTAPGLSKLIEDELLK